MNKFLQTTHRNIIWFKEVFEKHELEMRPPFQRNPVWTVKQQSFLIDTILHGYPIPEIYMQDQVDGNGNKKYIVVDGQQRITACLDFMCGKFAIDGEDSPTFSGLMFEDLTLEQKKLVYSYNFVIRQLPDLPDIEMRDIFQRLNRNNVILNSQELRQATYWGPFIKTMNELATLEVWTKTGIFTVNDIKRMLDVEFISELAIAVLHGLQNKKQNLDKYYQLYEDDFPQRENLIETFRIITKEMVSILPEISDTRWSKKTDYYTLFLLFSKYKKLLPLTSKKRKLANNLLLKFAADVDEYVKVEKIEGEISDLNENIKQYALNIRASSDLGARKKREEALEEGLKSLWK